MGYKGFFLMLLMSLTLWGASAGLTKQHDSRKPLIEEPYNRTQPSYKSKPRPLSRPETPREDLKQKLTSLIQIKLIDFYFVAWKLVVEQKSLAFEEPFVDPRTNRSDSARLKFKHEKPKNKNNTFDSERYTYTYFSDFKRIIRALYAYIIRQVSPFLLLLQEPQIPSHVVSFVKENPTTYHNIWFQDVFHHMDTVTEENVRDYIKNGPYRTPSLKKDIKGDQSFIEIFMSQKQKDKDDITAEL